MRDRAFTTGWKRAAVVAAAAYALVIQALLLSFGGAVQAAAASGPQILICAPGSEVGPDHAPLKTHDGLCCLVGCHGSGAAGPAPGPALAERLAPVAAVIARPGEAPDLRPSSSVLPVGSRAPPYVG